MRNLITRALNNRRTPPRFRVTGFATQGGLRVFTYAFADVVVVGVGIVGALPVPPIGP